ncbi:ATP-binding cassette domain-containing protein [Ornithinibacillus sp. L9]|uniref:ATP-binding cassette domain-containing protein n=1 Tax=Ornithinibacillus caprae TaxID=2678566 RepID=A0A6N8FIF2_9BACI|nr:ABC transporter ATP-binding protein [Ornithinibacillus caprae]MUK89442.1 ATP-binding cassette domain-containing protein [Ornithinibacillus caprae]
MLNISNVSKHYEKTKALDDVSFHISKGSCFGLVGPNGAGKSTLMKILASIIHDYTGDVFIDNKILTPEQKEKIGYVPQDICLEEGLSAIGNLSLFGKLYGLTGKKLKLRAIEVLKQINLEKRANDKVSTFSGGMKRRLNIGCSLMHNPDILIMDEATVGIDPQSRNYIFQMINRIKNDGRTIIYASHYIEEVELLCDEVVFIDSGVVVEKGAVNDLLKQYATPSIFIKGTPINLDKMKQYGDVVSKKGGYILSTNEPLQVMENMIAYCREHVIELEQLELVQPRLEDIFFSLTGSELRE